MEANPSIIKDELTGAFNNTYFHERLQQEIHKSDRYGKPCSIVRFDIDNFKDVNEKYGFELGNIILKQVADLCKKGTRGSDILARQASEEFLVILPEIGLNDANVFAERIRKSIENNENFGSEKQRVKITISMGIATYSRKEARDITQLMQLLDTAVFQAKQDGRNCIVLYTTILPPDEFI